MEIGNFTFICFINNCHCVLSAVEIIIYLLLIAIGCSGISGTISHRIELLNITYQDEKFSLCPRSNVGGLLTRMA